MTTWSWQFRDAKVADESGLTDVIKSIGYKLTGARGDELFAIGGETRLGPADPANFTPFASLTSDQVIAIVGTVVSIDSLKTQIDAWHDEKIKPLPFA